MSLISHVLQQDATKITTITDKYGDQLEDSNLPLKCRFRYITEIDNGTNQEGIRSGEAIIWFEPDADIQEGSIVEVDGKYWRVNRLIKARRLSGNAVEFLKAIVNNHQL